MRSFSWLAIVATGAFLMSWSPDLHAHQEPTPAPPATQSQPPPETPATPSSSSKHSPQKYSHANDFLIRGTVFTDKALSFPGAQLRIRRAGETGYNSFHAASANASAVRGVGGYGGYHGGSGGFRGGRR